MKDIERHTGILSKWFFVAFFLLFSNFVFASIKIIVVSHGQAPDVFWDVVKKGVTTAKQDFRRSAGLKVYYRSPATFDMVEMIRMIEKAIAEKPDGLVVTIPDGKLLGPSIRKAVKAGIPVVSMNSGYSFYKDLGISAHVGQDEFQAGVVAGRRLKSLGVRNILVINHEQGNIATTLRLNGLVKVLSKKVNVLNISGVYNDIRKVVEEKLKKNRNIDAIITLGVRSGKPVFDLLNDKFKNRKIKFASFDLLGDLLEGIKNGKVSFLVDQNPYMQGYLPIAILVQYVRYGVMPVGGVLTTGPGIISLKNSYQKVTSDFIKLSKKGYR